MPTCGSRLVALGLLGALAASRGVLAQPADPEGTEFQANVYVTGDQARPAADMDASGDFVVVWSSAGQDGSTDGVFGRRFNAAGVAQGAELQVNLTTASVQRLPAVSMDADGDFVVAWQSSGQDGNEYGVFARRFNSSGTALGAEIQANAHVTGFQRQPAVAVDADGDFVVVWHSNPQDMSGYGVFGRRFNAAGVAQGSEFQVNVVTLESQIAPSVGMDTDGDFVVAWQSIGQEGAGPNYGVFARRFNALGVAQGGEIAVNTFFTSHQTAPSVRLAGDGRFVVAWQSDAQDGANAGVFARRFSAAGVAQGAEIPVNLVTTNNQQRPAVKVDDDGDFTVAWESYGQDGQFGGIFVRHFASSGAPQGGEHQVNTHTADIQSFPALGSGGGAGFVVAWQSLGQDGSGEGVFGQRFGGTAILDIDGNGALTALTDGLLVLRYLFGLTGTSLTGSAVGAGCTRCDATTIKAYLDTLI